MCFSAAASFGASAILGLTGIISLKTATKKTERMFAAIPLLFAVQQAAEGILWLSLSGDYGFGPSWQAGSVCFFLLFAQVVWPVWIPVSILRMEQDAVRRRWLYVALGAGIVCAGLLLYRMLAYPVEAVIQHRHIHYELGSNTFIGFSSSILYVMATLAPAFISSRSNMYLLGVLLVFSLLVSKVFYEEELISVWCFFAAFLSIVTIYILYGFRREAAEPLRPDTMSGE